MSGGPRSPGGREQQRKSEERDDVARGRNGPSLPRARTHESTADFCLLRASARSPAPGLLLVCASLSRPYWLSVSTNRLRLAPGLSGRRSRGLVPARWASLYAPDPEVRTRGGWECQPWWEWVLTSTGVMSRFGT